MPAVESPFATIGALMKILITLAPLFIIGMIIYLIILLVKRFKKAF